MADDPDEDEVTTDDMVEVCFAPSYHLQWLVGDELEIVFLPDG